MLQEVINAHTDRSILLHEGPCMASAKKHASGDDERFFTECILDGTISSIILALTPDFV